MCLLLGGLKAKSRSNDCDGCLLGLLQPRAGVSKNIKPMITRRRATPSFLLAVIGLSLGGLAQLSFHNQHARRQKDAVKLTPSAAQKFRDDEVQQMSNIAGLCRYVMYLWTKYRSSQPSQPSQRVEHEPNPITS